MRTTLKDVAKLAGVNFTLVSKYLNNNQQARMTKETRERIDRALRELQYRPSSIARSLRNGCSHTVGLVSGGLTNPYNAHIANLALKIFSQHGYQLLIALCEDKNVDAALNSLCDRDMDGIFVSAGLNADALPTGCPVQGCDNPEPVMQSVCLKLDQSLDEALCVLPGRVIGLFFHPSSWQGAFLAAAERSGRVADCECRDLDLERDLRRDEIRNVCRNRPDSILTSGWETMQMLQELCDSEFPDYHPHLLLHANCRGSFLNAPGIVGVIYSSTSSLIKVSCLHLIERIKSKGIGQTPPPPPLPTCFIPSDSEKYRKLVATHFELT
ncbi:MAG: LacI family transcriptional regulator [Victivallales bacterium]|jgi:hypothetical protein|nr:LacI family transcriptional regulator [Victivallales bacterium]